MPHHHRPRASDFDEPARERTAGSSSPPPHSHRTRRPSPNYDRGNHVDQNRQRLTPEESLDRHHPSNPYYDRSNSRPNAPSNGYRQGGRDDFFEQRRLQRETAQIAFWPRSPSHPYGEDKKRKSSHKDDHHSKEKKRKSHHKSKSSKSKKYQSDSETDSSERSERHHRSRKHKSKHCKKHRHDDDFSEGESENSQVGKKELKRKGKSKSVEIEEDAWVEKEVQVPTVVKLEGKAVRKDSITGPVRPEKVEERMEAEPIAEENDIGEVGPMPYNHATGKAMDPKEFGRALRPGEGSAMAAFIEAGERIPRRGEIGLTGNQIEQFENVGYVMSGSRHRRMNAVRIRKENQVISAEEKRGILKMQAEEKAKREGQIISSFRELVDTKLQETS